MTTEVPTIEPVEQLTLAAIRPGVGWYVMGGVVIAAGLVAGFFLLTAGAFGYLGEIDDLARTSIPGETSIDLPAGELTVFHEPEGATLGTPESLALSVRGPDGGPVALEPPERTDRYSTQERQGIAIAGFAVAEAGRHDVSTTSGSGSLAIGPSPGRRLTRFGLGALISAAVAIGVGTTLLVITARRRRRSITARAATQQSMRPVERLVP